MDCKLSTEIVNRTTPVVILTRTRTSRRSVAARLRRARNRPLPRSHWMFNTKNDLSEAIRVKAIALLNARLADAIDLQTQTKQAHWNVKGPHFIALHELFDKINEDIEDYVDLIAERAVQLGGSTEGTARSVAKRSTLAEYPLKSGTGRQHVDALSSALAAFGKVIRSAIEESDRAGDDDTNDIFIEISRGVDKWLWMVEAHLSPDE